MEFSQMSELLKKECGVKKEVITEDDRLTEDLYMNSLSYMLLVVSIEKKLNISIPPDKLKNTETAGELYHFINEICR